MKTIWKYTLPLEADFEIEMPINARILAFDTQETNKEPQIWVLVDSEAPKELRRFRIFGTGHRINEPDRLNYIGTIQVLSGRLVWHLFEVIK